MNSIRDKLKKELQESINLLTQKLKELEDIVAEPEEQAEIDAMILKIIGKIKALKRVMKEIEASEVVIPGVTPEAEAALNAEIEKLNQKIQKEKDFNNILQAATDILDAVGKVIPELQNI